VVRREGGYAEGGPGVCRRGGGTMPSMRWEGKERTRTAGRLVLTRWGKGGGLCREGGECPHIPQGRGWPWWLKETPVWPSRCSGMKGKASIPSLEDGLRWWREGGDSFPVAQKKKKERRALSLSQQWGHAVRGKTAATGGGGRRHDFRQWYFATLLS